MIIIWWVSFNRFMCYHIKNYQQLSEYMKRNDVQWLENVIWEYDDMGYILRFVIKPNGVSFDVSKMGFGYNVRNISYTFAIIHHIKVLRGFDRWNMKQFTQIDHMFSESSSLETIEGLDNWTFSPNMCNLCCMFYMCQALKSFNVSNWNVSNVTMFYGMFMGCKSIVSLDLSNWDMSKAERLENMFQNCSSLVSIKLPKIPPPANANLSGMFCSCSSLVSIENLDKWIEVSRASELIKDMFKGCYMLTTSDDATPRKVVYDMKQREELETLKQQVQQITNTNEMKQTIEQQANEIKALKQSNEELKNMILQQREEMEQMKKIFQMFASSL